MTTWCSRDCIASARRSCRRRPRDCPACTGLEAMRTVFFILALANAVFFAYAWFGGGAEANGDAHIIGQQLKAEKIRLLTPEQVSVLTRKPEPPKVATVCLEWGAFVGGDAARAGQELEPLGLGAKLTQRKQEDVAGFWVYRSEERHVGKECRSRWS